MKIIDPQIYIDVNEIDPRKMQTIEKYGRVCYKSEDKIDENSAAIFLKTIIARGHESVIEHEKATVVIITDRGVTHEIVRHRIGSYSQESTRYCNYSLSKFGNELTVISPYFYDDSRQDCKQQWQEACQLAEKTYLHLLKLGRPEEARSILPNSLKTQIVITYNFREWRHFFKLRCASTAHPQMRQIAIPLLLTFNKYLPPLFADIDYDHNFDPIKYAKVHI